MLSFTGVFDIYKVTFAKHFPQGFFMDSNYSAVHGFLAIGNDLERMRSPIEKTHRQKRPFIDLARQINIFDNIFYYKEKRGYT